MSLVCSEFFLIGNGDPRFRMPALHAMSKSKT